MKKSLFDKVLFIGPDIKGKGGISSVLCSYGKMIAPFHYMSSNSRYGTIVGILVLIKLLICMPYYSFVKRIKIVHIHGASGKSFVRKRLIMRWTKLFGRKVVFHCHSAEFESYVDKIGRDKIVRELSEYDSIVVLSQKWFTFFSKSLGLSNIVVINNIVEKVEHNIQKADTDIVKMLFLGAIGERKGIFDLLDVVSRHKNELRNKIKILIGGNGEIDRLKNFIEKNDVADCVEYVGWVSGDRKSELLQECDVVVLPSYNEGLPIVLLEAMANGKPSITTNVGGIPEIVETGANGVVFEPGDKTAIYNAIKLFIDNPQLIKQYGAEGLKRVEKFYPDSVKAQLENLYMQLLK